MASSVPRASDSWHDALKLRKHLLRNLEKLQVASASGLEIQHFDMIDNVLERFRLACVSTIFLDFDYAAAQNTEEAMWMIHTSINSEYRRTLSRLKQSSHAVEKRKVEKLYNNFLRIAQKFYKTYIQRLSARYDIQELKRVAKGIDLEQLATEDTITPVPEVLRSKVLTSCHSTLIRLGDLTRYRIQAKHKGSYEAALAYYGLAHHLRPHSGFAFHQMGIVHLDQGNHLDVVYHFYRAWAVEMPHPNAKLNLESEFKTLQLGSQSSKSKHGAHATQDAFTMWFVRLHAQYYKGEASGPKQTELEKEVIHRLEMTGRNAIPALNLLKMALVNMSSQHVAALRYCESKSDAVPPRFYQYALHFNARFIVTICGVLESQLQETSNVKDVLDVPDATHKPAVVETLLPVLRVYCLWLAAHRQEVFGAVDAFGTLIPKMIQTLARVFTLLCVETYNQDNIKTAPYLLMEDVEIRGLQPVKEDLIPEGCRFFCSENGNYKPLPPAPELRLDASGEKTARILDILRCAYFFTEDETIPLVYRIEGNSLVFEYAPVAKPSQPLAATATGSPPIEQSTGPSQQTSGDAAKVGGNEEEENQDKAEGEAAADKDNKVESRAVKAGQTSQAPATRESLPKARGVEDSTTLARDVTNDGDMDDADDTVLNMLTPFLKPPTPQPQHHPRSPAESSYGMHTSTANELFAFIDAQPTPSKSVSSGKFQPLPWGWFNTPVPERAQDSVSSAGADAFNGQCSATQSPSMSVAATKFLEDPFATPGRHSSNAFAREPVGELSSSRNVAAERAHKERLLQTFGKVGSPRSSTVSQWSHYPTSARENAVPSSVSDPWTFEGPSFSSSFSRFSHPSSLYLGTPAGGGHYASSPISSDLARSISQDAFRRELGQPAGRHFQVDKTTSSYDEAIFKAACQGPWGGARG